MPEQERSLATEDMRTEGRHDEASASALTVTAILKSLERLEAASKESLEYGVSHEKGLESITARLDILNGSVATLTKESIESRIFQARHANTVEKIEELEKEFHGRMQQRDDEVAEINSRFDTEKKVSAEGKRINASYRDAMRPVFTWLIIGVISLILWNGQNILVTMAKALKVP